MSFEQFADQGDTTIPRNVRKSDEPRVRNLMQTHELPEVGVIRHKDSTFRLGPLQQRTIARIRTQLASLSPVMPVAAKPVRQTPAGAAIDKEPHVFLTEMGGQRVPGNDRARIRVTGEDILWLQVGIVVEDGALRHALLPAGSG